MVTHRRDNQKMNKKRHPAGFEDCIKHLLKVGDIFKTDNNKDKIKLTR